MKYLKDILEGVSNTVDIPDIKIKGITSDSREVGEGYIFVAIKGEVVDGHSYVEKAIERGATVIMSEESMRLKNSEIINIQVSDTRKYLGVIASNFYDRPSEQFKLIGVTGTNGKTTITSLLYQLMTDLGFKCGLISTIKYVVGKDTFESKFTTPGPMHLQKLMHQMVEENCEYVFMEVSSHAIHQKRIEGLEFDVAMFTNITHDHLDYHNDFKEYIRVKKMFFDNLSPKATAITNIDDRNGEVMVQNSKANIKSYALKKLADYKGRILSSDIHGLMMKMNEISVHLKLGGEFNAYNMLAVYAAATELEVGNEEEILAAVSNLRSVEGRMEIIRLESKNAIAIVDYAHTPDALENVLKSIKKLKTKRIITVVGCGGDRDKTKRPKMAKIAVSLSDSVILTSDNPRTEDPVKILDDMASGLNEEESKKVLRIVDREQGIKTGLQLLNENEVLLVAGKGHEKYQDINGEKFPFDDKRKIIALS